MLKDMEKLMIKARREAERQNIEKEAYILQQQQNTYFKKTTVDRSVRIAKL
jgi:hypothetical protein